MLGVRALKFLIRDKSFYKSFLSITVALALQQLLSYGVNLTDNVMLGAYSEAALAGSAIVSQLHYILQLMVNGIGTGIVMIGSRYWGMKQPEPIRHFLGMGWKLAVALGVLFGIVTMLAPDAILSIYTNDRRSPRAGTRIFKAYELDLCPVPDFLLPYVGLAQRRDDLYWPCAFGSFACTQFLPELYFYIWSFRRTRNGRGGLRTGYLNMPDN